MLVLHDFCSWVRQDLVCHFLTSKEMTLQLSRYMKMDAEARDLIRARAKQRYRESPEEHRMKRYLHAFNKGVTRCPK